jgi:hypothetical protein
MSVAEFGAHLQVEVENKSAITHQA